MEARILEENKMLVAFIATGDLHPLLERSEG
jgi:hypothetical protein